MGSDDLFKKRRETRKQRQHEYKTPKANSFLIVTEGERTEPLYFKGLQKLIKEKVGGIVDIVEQPVIDIHGEGCSTNKLVEVTGRIVKDAKIMYQNVWVVFDKDDFEDFDKAVKEGTEKGYNIAWSNQSFEYWLYLHFNYNDSALHRHQWNEKLDELFKQKNLGNGTYQKNYENIYEMVDLYDGVNTAIKYAKRRMAEFEKGEYRPSECDPGTTVYRLVEELKRYLE
ncbi:MAG: RloB family protein [Lachnospiraceae bacterium]|nr:RloB family protein [Lachnospiraceae bacterium]MDE7200618.1 RloB family protein [Lachnospiraceae bacterium]